MQLLIGLLLAPRLGVWCAKEQARLGLSAAAQDDDDSDDGDDIVGLEEGSGDTSASSMAEVATQITNSTVELVQVPPNEDEDAKKLAGRPTGEDEDSKKEAVAVAVRVDDDDNAEAHHRTGEGSLSHDDAIAAKMMDGQIERQSRKKKL